MYKFRSFFYVTCNFAGLYKSLFWFKGNTSFWWALALSSVQFYCIATQKFIAINSHLLGDSEIVWAYISISISNILSAIPFSEKCWTRLTGDHVQCLSLYYQALFFYSKCFAFGLLNIFVDQFCELMGAPSIIARLISYLLKSENIKPHS